MKNLKTTILTALFAISCLTNVNAQENARKNRGKVVMSGSPGTILVLGGGLSSPSSEAKDKAFFSNTTAINADLFLPILKKEGASFNFGINLGGTYSFGGSADLGTLPNPYLVSGQTSSIVSDRGGSPIQAEFRMGAGPQANFYLGKLIVSPMVLAQYMSVTQKERSAVQTTVVGGQSYDFNLATLPETKTSGFAVTPKLRLHYMFSERFGLFADASYTMGPKAETVIRKLFPNGAPNTPTNDYDLQALQTANFENGKTKSTALNSMGFNFGVVIGLGGISDDESRPRHKCLICGRKHRGICKWGDATITPHDDGKGQKTNKTAEACTCCAKPGFGDDDEHVKNCCAGNPIVETDDIKKGLNGNMVVLTDLDRPLNSNEKVTFIEIDKFNIKTGNTFVKNDILLTYKLKKDNNGNIYGIPSVLVGIIIPADDIENLLKSPCSPPCLTVKTAGSCGRWCGNILHPAGIINDFKFDDNKDVTLLNKKQDKIEIYEQLNVNGKKFFISILGTSKQKQTIFESNYCNTYITGFGNIAFPHIFTATCEVAGEFIQSLYLNYGIEKNKK